MLEKYKDETVEETFERLKADMSKHRRMGYLTPLVSINYPLRNLEELKESGKIKMSVVDSEICDYPLPVFGVELI